MRIMFLAQLRKRKSNYLVIIFLFIVSGLVYFRNYKSQRTVGSRTRDEVAESTDQQHTAEPTSQSVSIPDTSLDFLAPSPSLLEKKSALLKHKHRYAEIDFQGLSNLNFNLYGVSGQRLIFTNDQIKKDKLIKRLDAPSSSCNDSQYLLFDSSDRNATKLIDPLYPFKNIELGSQLHVNLIAFQYQMSLGPKLVQEKAIKHFYEVPGHNHLDLRFGNKTLDAFNGHDEPNSSRSKTLKLLLTAWALFCDQNRIPYNIAHGLLIGWVWNKKMLPWDNDLDVNVPARYLKKLFSMGNKTYFGRYLLDLSPEYTYRRESNFNIIDGRFIDTETGYYIDITGLSVPTLPIVSKYRMLKDTILHDKKPSPHTYNFNDIYPLVRTTLDGIPTWRPYNVSALLLEEYQPQGTPESFTYFNYQFDPFLKTWVEITSCERLHEVHIAPRLDFTLPRFDHSKSELYTLVWNSHNASAPNPSPTSCSLVFWKFRNGQVLERRVLFGEWEERQDDTDDGKKIEEDDTDNEEPAPIRTLPGLQLSRSKQKLLDDIEKRNKAIYAEIEKKKKVGNENNTTKTSN